MVMNAVRSFWTEPQVADAPARVWRDWPLVGALVTAALLEGVLRDDVLWRGFATALAVGLAFSLLWRRTHPLAVVLLVFGTINVLNLVDLVTSIGSVGLYTMFYVLLLPYALLRWGSGREIVLGLTLIVLTGTFGLAVEYTNLGEALAGMLFLLFPATVGATVRYWATAMQREVDTVKLNERAELARELHDTVAHHVSAIAIRAQAGQLVSVTDPAAAEDALRVIEEEASRTLAEMRLMIGGLRREDPADLAPQRGVADLDRMARNAGPAQAGSRPRIDVHLDGDLDDLSGPLDAALYRIAQESITNALRHAQQATTVTVQVAGDEDSVRLSVHDDGTTAAARDRGGYGLIGMTERATLLGGTLEAGPSPDRGWTVTAILPRMHGAR